jgi:hypothetical protein
MCRQEIYESLNSLVNEDLDFKIKVFDICI